MVGIEKAKCEGHPDGCFECSFLDCYYDSDGNLVGLTKDNLEEINKNIGKKVKKMDRKQFDNLNGFVQTSMAILKIKSEPDRYFETFELAKYYVEIFNIEFYQISNDYIAIDIHHNFMETIKKW